MEAQDDALEAEERAYQMLQWAALAPLAPFNEELASSGFYSRVQKERSDKALDAFDAARSTQSTISELDAFRELCRLKVLSESDLYSPDKAQRRPRYLDPQNPGKGDHLTDTSYTDDLKRFKSQQQIQGATGGAIQTRTSEEHRHGKTEDQKPRRRGGRPRS